MTTQFKTTPFTIALLCLIGLATSATKADPLPGETPKFIQQPMVSTNIGNQLYHGHDEVSTLYATNDPSTGIIRYEGTTMADDFADPIDTPVVHVRWWGSYLGNFMNADSPVDQFLIAFESDVPADQNPLGFSHPGEVLSSQVVRRGALAPGSGTFTERRIFEAPAGGEDIYEYNAELHLGKEFPQKSETVYWLKIAALVDPDDSGIPPVQWGWHNRDYTIANPFAAAVTPPVAPGERDERIELGGFYPTPVWHFQDDAVSALTQVDIDPMMPSMPLKVLQDNYQPQRYLADLDGPAVIVNADGTLSDGIGRFSKDLAFELYTRAVPEPSSVLLLGTFLAAGVATWRRRS